MLSTTYPNSSKVFFSHLITDCVTVLTPMMEILINLRALRYLSGRQMAESFYHELDKDANKQKEGNDALLLEPGSNSRRYNLCSILFQHALEPQLYGTGTVMQSQLTASSERWLSYIDDLANEGYKNKNKTPERWLTEVYVGLFTRYPTVEDRVLDGSG